MAETQSKETQEALIRDLDEQYKICKHFNYICVVLIVYDKEISLTVIIDLFI